MSDPSPTIMLDIEDIGVTEAWLRIAIPDTIGDRSLIFLRDGVPLDTTVLNSEDSVIVQEELLPNQTYVFQAFRLADSVIVDSTDVVVLTTLGTTSHNFVWRMDTLGIGGSFFRDVLMLSEDEVWAVGSLYLPQSKSPSGERYNLASWDGSEWATDQVLFPICDANGNELGTTVDDVVSAFGLVLDDIWLASHGDLVRWTGGSFERICMPLGYGSRSFTSFWESTESRYLVGTGGFIVHHDGFLWREMESGTEIDIRDIRGTPDGGTVWASGHQSSFTPSILLEYDGTAWRTVKQVYSSDPISTDSLSGAIRSVWPSSRWDVEVATAAGMYRVKKASSGEAIQTWIPAWGTIGLFSKVRGSARNNIFVVGEFGTIAHYDGVEWYQYTEFFSLSGYPIFTSVAVTDQMVVAVGYAPEGGIILTGTRN